MNNKFKKILTTAIISTLSFSVVGCGNENSKLAKNIDNGVANFVSAINKLDYVDTASNEKIGKIVEASNVIDDENFSKTLSALANDNNITLPEDRTDNFKLFVLSDRPFISFSSDDDNAEFNFQLKFSTSKIEDSSKEINEKINKLILKRSILMIYANEIYNDKVNLSNENRVAINAYINVIKENASYLDGNRGMVKNQLSLARDLASSKSNDNLINYYMIKSGEALETRANKIDSTISAMDSIISIIESNLKTNSAYYNCNLSCTYNSLVESLKSTVSSKTSTENKTLADSLTNVLDLPERQIRSASDAENRDNEANANRDANQNEQSNENSTNNTNQNLTESNKTNETTYAQNRLLNSSNVSSTKDNNLANIETKNLTETKQESNLNSQNKTENNDSLVSRNQSTNTTHIQNSGEQNNTNSSNRVNNTNIPNNTTSTAEKQASLDRNSNLAITNNNLSNASQTRQENRVRRPRRINSQVKENKDNNLTEEKTVQESAESKTEESQKSQRENTFRRTHRSRNFSIEDKKPVHGDYKSNEQDNNLKSNQTNSQNDKNTNNNETMHTNSHIHHEKIKHVPYTLNEE